MDNQKLIQDCIKNKKGAQQALYKSYATVFFRLAFRYVKHKEDAEDVVLESFMQIFDHLSSFMYHSEAQTEAWMKRIVINQALKKLRKANSFLFTDFDQVELEDHSAVGIEDYMTANEILELICTLPPGYRTVFNLFVVEGYAHNEIAGMLNITENTSRSQLFKAKAFLREKLNEETETSSDMTEEQLIRRKIADLNDLDLSFNTDEGWKKLDQRRKKPVGNWMTHIQRIAALLVLVGVIWLLISKLAYFRKIEVSEHKPLPSVEVKPTEKTLAIKKTSSQTRTHIPVKTLKAEQKKQFDVEAIQNDLPKLSLNIRPVLPELKRTDSIPEADKPTPARVVHLNDIPRTYLHSNPAKPKVFYVRIGTESVEVNPERQPKTISYIIK